MTFFKKRLFIYRTIKNGCSLPKGHKRKYTKMYPFFQGEVESTEKKWVFCWKTFKKL